LVVNFSDTINCSNGCANGFSLTDAVEGQPASAASLFGAAEVQWRASGGVRYAPERSAYEQDLGRVRAQLDQTAFAAAWEAGQRLTVDEAIALALKQTARAANWP
jgi:hypothetical protein